MAKQKIVFLTGSTGLIGSYLLKVFLQNGLKVYTLARSRTEKTARDRVIDTLRFWDKDIVVKAKDNLVILEGDISDVNLGLDVQIRNLLKTCVDEIFHCAAITDLNRPMPEMKKTNIDGTRNVLDFALYCRNGGSLIKANHISTAYVYGSYEGLFKEGNLDVGQKFETNYEESKFRAELLVEDYRKNGLWVDIYRPPIVMGDSIEGRTFQFKHIYQFMNLCGLEIFDSLPVRGARVSLIPVDILCQAIYLISANTTNKNWNYHTFPRHLVPIEKVIEVASKVMEFKKPELIGMEDFHLSKLTPAQKAILRNTVLSINFKINLDSSYTNNLLSKLGLNIPDINDDILVREIKYFIKKLRDI